jgi:hypothetical protein
MPKSSAERTRAWRERKRTSEVTVQNVKRQRASEGTVQNVKKRKNRSEIERDSRERSRIRASLHGVNNKDNEPATSTSAQPPLLAPIRDNVQYSDFPVIQKFHFYRASLRHTLFFISFNSLFILPSHSPQFTKSE